MAWIESHQKLEKSGKLLKLSELLGINRYQAIGHLHALWWWALDNASNGDVTRYCNALVTLTGLDEVQKNTYADHINVEWYDNEKVVHAFIESGFLDEKDGSIIIHDWNEYTWRYFNLLEKNKRRKELTKERVKRFRNAHVTQKKRDVTHATIPNHTNKEKKEIEIPSDLQESAIEIKDWLEYKRQRGENYKPKGLEALFRKFKSIDPKARREAVDFSMANSYAGLFAPNGSKTAEVKNDSWQH